MNKKTKSKDLLEARKKQVRVATLADDAIEKGDTAKAVLLIEEEKLHLADVKRIAEEKET